VRPAATRAGATVARQAQWTYRPASADEAEREFFAALEPEVVAEIGRRFADARRVAVGRELHLRVGTYAVRARLTNVEPLLADVMDGRTQVLAQLQERSADGGQDVSAFISEVVRYPNERHGAAFDGLVGLDDVKADLVRKLASLLAPSRLDAWARDVYGSAPPDALLRMLRERYPLVLLEGEVGSGKTALAYGVGHRLATVELGGPLALLVVNAQVRGGGHVGELTQNIARAFTEAERCSEREDVPVLILVDEVDALAQTRGGSRTHHEDNAGVNTLIQRIDRLRGRPIAAVFATNLVRSLDAAILRRAAAVYHFDRPTTDQRRRAFATVLRGVRVSDEELGRLADLTGPRRLPGDVVGAQEHRYTYSDLVQRIVPHAVEQAFCAGRPLDVDHLVTACASVPPTPEASVE
jgi:SpoVK/Ycf46/Vps4 family AAA+-type ATPase